MQIKCLWYSKRIYLYYLHSHGKEMFVRPVQYLLDWQVIIWYSWKLPSSFLNALPNSLHFTLYEIRQDQINILDLNYLYVFLLCKIIICLLDLIFIPRILFIPSISYNIISFISIEHYISCCTINSFIKINYDICY